MKTPNQNQAGPGRSRVLLVADDAGQRAVLATAVAASGREVMESGKLEDAIARLGASDFDALVVDLSPGDSEELLRFLGVSLRRAPRIILVLSELPDTFGCENVQSEILVLAKPCGTESILLELLKKA